METPGFGGEKHLRSTEYSRLQLSNTKTHPRTPGEPAAALEERKVDFGGAAPAPSRPAKNRQVARHPLAARLTYQRFNSSHLQPTSYVHLGAAKTSAVQYHQLTSVSCDTEWRNAIKHAGEGFGKDPAPSIPQTCTGMMSWKAWL
ncbi:hypothetical protein CTAM01_12414 [Colletotrichum tamarilloi]|uniref:Uncharacterized protein n=1 Tax=Colletotrichum tamarilloi TaxID=1209934 RepID=A0ABQ9QUT4_9PEZI|nr:uncharacterized protein CTAM01_12414 [Colletotrichum tamarilloi]KAK1485871.1 hypothetical protein CTAM01_12414 [Colletotrichum tamarilloi]